MVAKNATITKDQAKEEMLRITTELGRVPKRDEFFKMTNLKGCHKQGISILFGKNPFNNLILYSGLEVNVHPKEPKQIVNCKTCSKEIEKFANELRKHENSFCSSSCAAKHNNPLKQKANGKYVLKEKVCLNCTKTYTKDGRDARQTCSMFCYMELGMKQRLMKDVIKRNDANKYDTVRKNARTYSKHFYPSQCMICSYDKHYEVCHVKDLKDFTREETLYEVNNKTNLIHLCPNCHWEFDHNQLDIQKIREAQKAAFTP